MDLLCLTFLVHSKLNKDCDREYQLGCVTAWLESNNILVLEDTNKFKFKVIETIGKIIRKVLESMHVLAVKCSLDS